MADHKLQKKQQKDQERTPKKAEVPSRDAIQKPHSSDASQPPLKDLVWEVFQHYANDIPYHSWFNERKRWLELVVCILYSFGAQAGQNARRAVSMFEDLGLLDVAELAELPWRESLPDLTHPHLSLMSSILQRFDFVAQDIPLVLGMVMGVARDLQTHYQGLIQLYLRQHGKRMLDNLQNDFSGLSTSDERLIHAFAIWLQNVLTMPVLLDTPSLQHFCQSAGCTLDELYQAADALNISASILDDVVDIWAVEHKT